MTAAKLENRAENSEADKSEVPKIQGRVDAFENGRLLGWAWDAANPDDRMTIHVFHDGERVMSKLADTKRIDLQRNGIGDGGYAFDLQLPQAAASAPEGLSVVAESPKDGVQLKLPRPSAEERAAEAAIALPLSIVMKKLDRVISIQGQSALGQRDATELLKKTTSRIDELASTEGELGEALKILKNGQGDLAQRVKELEVFLLRFDTTLKGFDDRLIALGDRHKNNLKVHLLLLAVLLGFVGGMVFAAAGGLWS
ncbi:hypothetical protein [uncultured Roseibium sp.]|uniref:hypothetical protein n=1 Tax=uncultured Roseibium sp. TaxID=1936171 RepID=UPI0026373AEE|nr:hypothetical protein [uncultured Roseibium sp.]